MNCCLIGVVLAGMIILSGCLQEKDADSIPESPVPAMAPVTSAHEIPSTLLPAGSPAPGPLPFIPGATYRSGDEILITGTTILSPGNPLLIEIQSIAFGPSNKTDPDNFSGTTAVIEVMNGSLEGQNTWRYLLNTSGFIPGEYYLDITGLKVQGFHETATFTLIP
jgi:hypothetical protein